MQIYSLAPSSLLFQNIASLKLWPFPPLLCKISNSPFHGGPHQATPPSECLQFTNYTLLAP